MFNNSLISSLISTELVLAFLLANLCTLVCTLQSGLKVPTIHMCIRTVVGLFIDTYKSFLISNLPLKVFIQFTFKLFCNIIKLKTQIFKWLL